MRSYKSTLRNTILPEFQSSIDERFIWFRVNVLSFPPWALIIAFCLLQMPLIIVAFSVQ